MRAQRLREAMATSDGPLLLPGVWDPLSALLVREAGFAAAFVSGFCVAASHLGEPDIGLLGQAEMADVARRTCAAVPELPLIVDADTGYGDAPAVARTVALWEAAGAAGLFLEDQVWPKRCGHMADKEVVPVEAWLAKLRVAMEERGDLHITARTDARGPLGLQEAIDRGRRAAELGVDAVFVEAPTSVDELAAIGAALDGVPLVANMVETGRTPLLTPSELGELGFSLVVSPLSLLLGIVGGARGLLAQLHTEGTLRDELDGVAPFSSLTDLVGLPGHLSLAARHAPEGSNVLDGEGGPRPR